MQDASGLHVDKPKNTRAAPIIQHSDIVGEGPRTSLRQSPVRHTEKKDPVGRIRRSTPPCLNSYCVGQKVDSIP